MKKVFGGTGVLARAVKLTGADARRPTNISYFPSFSPKNFAIRSSASHVSGNSK